jgi:ABC-type branched-subunit amino acid transport system ATPase component
MVESKPDAPVSAELTGEPLLQLSEVTAGYGGGDVLRGVSFSVVPGSITCIVGPNGAGKSTLLSSISGLLEARLGSISFKGHSIVGSTPRRILELGIVQVPQDHSLFPNMTVKENIEMGAFLVRDRKLVAERLERVMTLFPVVATRAKARAGTLSGGQQRMTEFARCLMLDPSLVILDEPTMGLDPKTSAAVFEAVTAMNESGLTVLLVEQNARAGLRLASHGVVLENGRVRLVGTGHEVLHHPDIGALYLGGALSTNGS